MEKTKETMMMKRKKKRKKSSFYHMVLGPLIIAYVMKFKVGNPNVCVCFGVLSSSLLLCYSLLVC